MYRPRVGRARKAGAFRKFSWEQGVVLALGINDDLYTSGVAASDGERLLYAANEERFTRRKNDGGFPRAALTGMLDYLGEPPESVTDICLAGILTPQLLARLLPSLQEYLWQSQNARSETALRHFADFLIHRTPIARQHPGGFASRAVRRILPFVLRRQLPPALRHARIHIIEHHPAHAWCAYALSGYDSALCLTSDGMGDGVSLSISIGRGDNLERLAWGPAEHSLGLFFEALTEASGFVPGRDEGKLTGLAAHGAAARVAAPSPFSVKEGRLHYSGPHGLSAVAYLRGLLGKYPREDVAAWAQKILEDSLIAVTRYWLRKTRENRLVFGGGIAANVKLNQRLAALPEVEAIFVAPNMSDGGNPAGALAGCGFLKRSTLEHVFLGDDFTDAEIEQVLRSSGIVFERMADPAETLGALLAEGKTVGRLNGRMEWGPRALGNRSILASATDPAVVAGLNAKLRRTDFMPFAPCMLAEEADRFLMGHETGLIAGEFMTICYDCTQEMKALFPAVVHVDGTARAQIVRRDTNPSLHGILSAYARRTGAGVLLNTSFNIHEEPIVRTPQEALTAFHSAQLDCLVLGPWLVRGEQAVGG